MPEENQRITREHLPGLLLARAIWERGPSLYFPPALKTATDQARACSLEMKTHCVELYRDAPELHEVVLASEALAACAVRESRIVELEARIVWLECESQVSAAPVPEAKAQGIYSADPLACTGCKQGCFRCLSTADHVEGVRAMVAEPVQQVSVPDVSAMARTLADRNADACNVNREDNWAIYGQDYIDDVTAMLAAAPAAPAVDAGVTDHD